MSVIDLRKEFVKLQKEFIGGRVTKLKKHEVEHRISVLKQAMNLKEEIPAGAPARTGTYGPRDIPTKEVTIGDDTVVKKPLKPEGPDPLINPPRGPGKKKTVASSVELEVKEVEPKEPKKAKEPKEPKKAKVPPKVVFDDIKTPTPVERKTVSRPKSKGTAAPKTTPPAAEEEPKEMVAPVVPPVVKLPGGVRKLDD